ncbi:MAG: LamG-like jellyroll fold domain-containing protein [Verrucomicrobiota bacterium]
MKNIFRYLLVAAFLCRPAAGKSVEVAGSLLVELDAGDFKAEDVKWRQRPGGSGISGDFVAKGSPTRQVVGGADAVVFDGDGDYFIGPITTAALHAPGAKHSVEMWVFQGNVREQESVVSWGRRQGPDRSFAGFRYGSDPDFGAVARWGASESGFVNVPAEGIWHHLAFTYDGAAQSVYVDGKLDNTRAAGLLDTHDMLPIHLGAEIRGDLKLEGQFTYFSGALAKVRIHSGALSAAQVKSNFEGERPGFPGIVAKPLLQAPMHRFSFNASAAPAPDGTKVIDSIGGLAAVVRGSGAKFTGAAIELPGGSSDNAAYLDFPNGLISSRENLSIEFWETQTALQGWCRILSIGTNQAGEVTGPGGQFVGTETLTLFGNVGVANVNRFARSNGIYPNGGPDRNPAEYPDSDFGVEFQQVITYDKALKEWHWYRNGILMEVIPDGRGPTALNDVNVWLGRSEFSVDYNFRGRFREFRIYNHTLGENEILGNFLAGPGKLNTGGNAVAMNWKPEAPGIHAFANAGGSDHWNTGAGGPHPDGPGSVATYACNLSGDQQITLDSAVTLGSLNIGSRSRGGSFRLRAEDAGSITMDSGSAIPASITQLPGSVGNFIDAPVILRTEAEIANQSSSPLVLGGDIGGKGAFIKSGGGPVILTGDGSRHTGEVKIVAGALYLGDASDTGTIGASRFSITSPGRLVLNRGDDIETGGTYGGTGSIQHQGRGKLHLTDKAAVSNTGFLDFHDGSGIVTSDGLIDGPFAVRSDGNLVLRGHSKTRIRDWITIGNVNGGSLTLQDSADVLIEGAGHLNIGDHGRGQSTMFMSGGSVRFKEFFIGKNTGVSGVLLQTGGDLIKEGLLDSRLGGFDVGTADAWGAWRMTGGTFTDDWNFQIGAHGAGFMEVDGGTVQVAGFLGIGRYHTGHGVLDVKSGSVATTAPENLLLVGEEGIGVLNIRGRGRVTCANRMIIGAGAISKAGEGTVNLLEGGTLVTSGIGQMNQSEAIGRLNLNGGRLEAGRSNDNFISDIDLISVRKGGARIDTGGFDVGITQPLLAPRGNGVVSIPVKAGGGGYLVPPLIQINGGGGNGASAIAELADGKVRSLMITNPGTDYLSAPGVEILGGGSGGGLVLGTPVIAANTSGGLVKTGEGTLTLGGANNYPGPTSVKQGGLRLGNHLEGAVQVADGASFGGGGSVFGSLDMAPGSTLSPDPASVLEIRGDAAVHGSLVLDLTVGAAGRLDVRGKLDLGGTRLIVKPGSSKMHSPVHLIASYGVLHGKFALDDPLPDGYLLDYHYNGQNQIALVATAAEPDGE